MFGYFEGYDPFFGKIHDHKWHSLFRMCFVLLIVAVNHWLLVPRLYGQKQYLSFFTALVFCLIILLILPDIVVPSPKSGPPKFVEGVLRPFPMRTLMFDLIHIFLFFSICLFISIAIRIHQDTAQIDKEKIEEIKEIDENKEKTKQNQAIIMENNAEEEVVEKMEIDTALIVTVDYSLVRMPFSEILFIKSMGNYLQFFLKDKKPVLVRMTLKEASEKLPNTDFLRVHKSYIVAVAHIENIRNKMISINDQEIPIGRAYEEALLKVFGK
jgi:hypothetical protein